jgi:hypothetical protein
MPKKNLMLGETDSLPTLDQLSTMLNTKICWCKTQDTNN